MPILKTMSNIPEHSVGDSGTGYMEETAELRLKSKERAGNLLRERINAKRYTCVRAGQGSQMEETNNAGT